MIGAPAGAITGASFAFAQGADEYAAQLPDEATREEYYTVLSQPGALTGALNWYRAQGGLEDPGAPLGAANVDTPTLFIWGNRDTAIGREAAEGCAQYVSGPFEFVEVDAGHWLAQEAPAELATDLLAHLRKFAIAP